MPEANPLFAQLPAQVSFFTFDDGGKVHQAAIQVLDLQLANAELLDDIAHRGERAHPVVDRVAAQVEKSPESLFLYLACLRAGLVYLPLNTAYQRGEPPDGRLNNCVATAEEISHLRRMLGKMDREERDRLKGLDAKRVDFIVAGAALAYEPHRVAFWLHETIAAFHSYYTQGKKTGERFIGSDPAKTAARLALARALRQALANGLAVLGVSAPDLMESREIAEDV